MKVAFLGTPPPAVPALDALLDAGHEVSLVVTQPDRPAGRSRAPRPPAVKRRAEERGLPVAQPRGVRSPKFLEVLRDARPELLVVVAYGRILPGAVLELPARGAVNVHFSLLPRYRGAAPVQWALARGETTTGVTTMQIAEELDAGDVLLQRAVEIEEREHAPALERRLAAVGAELLVETLRRLDEDTLRPRPQDATRATLAPLLAAADGAVDPGLPAREIEGRIRGFDPWPGVWMRVAERDAEARPGRRVRLVEGRALGGPPVDAPAGRVLALEDDALVVACGAGTRLALLLVQAEGRRAVAARDAVNGRLIVPGDLLARPPAS